LSASRPPTATDGLRRFAATTPGAISPPSTEGCPGRPLRSVTVDDDLLGAVLERLDATGAAAEVERLLLAALDGDEALASALDSPGSYSGRPVRERPSEAGEGAARAYLASVTVTGFRGIGPAATLALAPGPGLTVVCGRNGSGKSSFAEGIEVLLTGGLRRFEHRSEVWKEGWRCLHGPPAAEVTAQVVVEGHKAPVTVRRTWEAGAGLEAGRVDGLDGLGWEEGLRWFRPFLTHSELESMLGAPKALHDQLNDILGLDDLSDAARRLATARLAADKTAKAPKDALPALRARLDSLDDERATTALAALGKKPDLDVLEALAAGRAGPEIGGGLGALDNLSRLPAPDPAALAATGDALTAAADRLDELAGGHAAEAAATASLLDAALDHYRRHGPGDCPVCAAPDRLDPAWQAATEAAVTRLRAEAADLDTATRAAAAALGAARAMVSEPPDALRAGPDVGVERSEALDAWTAWAATPAIDGGPGGLRAWASHLAGPGVAVIPAVAGVRDAAAAEGERRADRWAPVAAELAAWCVRARRADAGSAGLAALKKTEAWLKAANDQIRNDRLRPFASQTVALWSKLRQESNVDLTALRLAGSNTHARVDFDVTVDGNSAAALGVMSQGEVNALALSVFLPRATMPASPFRFLVIDDPVQAMDPSKVDGLAQVLADVAADRQVVVFTHDDRLPDAVRRLGLDARIIGVTRRPGSMVALHPAGDPCGQLLKDARSLTRGDGVPAPVARRVIPTLCRSAIETVCNDVTRRRRLAAGAAHDDVEAALADADKLTKKAALAIFDDPDRGGDVLAWLRDRIGPWAATTYQSVNRNAHGDDGFDAARLVGNTEDLAAQLRDRLP